MITEYAAFKSVHFYISEEQSWETYGDPMLVEVRLLPS